MTEVNAVQIPAYNKSDPALWFIMCESTFALATPKPITESITKYNYIVSHIPPDIASLVRDILIKPDATDPYGNLKTELINRSGESSTQEIRQLLSGEELGSRRPSELLRNMTRRAETFNVPEKLMLELFLQRLPSRVQSILAAVSDLTLAKLLRFRIEFSRLPQLRLRLMQYRERLLLQQRIGKRYQQRVEATYSLPQESRRLFIRDRISNVSFLVDTGSDVSLLPALEYHKRHPPQLTLFAANSSTINVYGQKTLSLDLNVRREFIWTFLLASVKTPILVADFLHYFELVPDLRHKCLRDLKTTLRFTPRRAPTLGANYFGWRYLRRHGHIKQAALHSAKTISSHETLYHDLLKSYPSITRLPDPTQPIKHNTVHFIKTNGPPVVAKPRRLAPDRLAIAKSEFQQMMQLGHLRPSSITTHLRCTWFPKKKRHFRLATGLPCAKCTNNQG
ncbi:retrovirus-related Pol polyprotein from transposon opus [Trichonephila clavipes]|nr:retrovirus-related Pol polyprotein from transposon opus [Trichonephila clavipes]